jgi:O-antigen/teichoic acid export membrane protein
MNKHPKDNSENKEHALTFFRQSGWLVIANTACGVFMTLVHPITKNMGGGEYPLFVSLLRVFIILGIPAAGLQTVLAQQAAKSLDPTAQTELNGVIRAALAGTFLIWLVAAGVVVAFHQSIMTHLKISEPMALWMTVLAVLPALWLPVLQGTLQGIQAFFWLGFSMIFNGIARFFWIILLVLVFRGRATSAMTAAFLGVSGALLIAAWPTRKMLGRPGPLIWGSWLGKTVPLTFGTGAILFVMSADVIFVQSHFPDEVAKLYSAAATLGLALVMFTTPMASVMFPKLVRSAVTDQKSTALFNALAGTALLGIVGALTCSFFPELPLSILYHGDKSFLRAAPLVKLFMWAMLPVTLANVLIGNLLARERWGAVPWLAMAAIGYGFSLNSYLRSPASVPFEAFGSVIRILGAFSLLLLAIAALFTWRARDKSITVSEAASTKL